MAFSDFVSAQGRWLREPLVHFIALGALLFAADRYVQRSSDDPRRIVVDGQRRRELAQIFFEGQGRQPRPDELERLLVQWSQNEVLYREALLMGLDKGDDMIRSRMVLKLRNVLFGNVVIAAPQEQELRAWFESHRERYGRPESFDFEQVRVAPLDHPEVARGLAADLRDGDVPAEERHRLRQYETRPRTNLVSLFGEEHTQALVGAPPRHWVAVSSSNAWHVARVTQRHEATDGDFDHVRSLVKREWEEHQRQARLSAALEQIVEQYDIRVLPVDEPPTGQELSRRDDDAEAL